MDERINYVVNDMGIPPPRTVYRPAIKGTFTQCYFNVGPPSATLAKHWNNIGSTSRVYWDPPSREQWWVRTVTCPLVTHHALIRVTAVGLTRLRPDLPQSRRQSLLMLHGLLRVRSEDASLCVFSGSLARLAFKCWLLEDRKAYYSYLKFKSTLKAHSEVP